ncbi:alkyl sulfatase dimerization domain-containing protein [Myxococcaceae bacterium GXIMD 01537]
MNHTTSPELTRWGRKLLALLAFTSCAHATPEQLAATAAKGAVGIDPSEPLKPENANPRLIQHSNFFLTPQGEDKKPQPSIYHLRERHWPLAQYPANLRYEAYSAVGFDLANTIVLVGSQGTKEGYSELVIVDTLGNGGSVEQVLPQLRTWLYGSTTSGPAKLPISAIIYTHNHIDHTGGVNAYLQAADRPPCPTEPSAQAGKDGYYNVDVEARVSGPTSARCVAVIAQENINSAVINTATVVGSIIDARSAYMYGNAVPLSLINAGIGPKENSGQGAKGSYYQMPSRTFSQKLNVTAAGLNLHLVFVPSETNDEIIAFLPDRLNVKGGGAPEPQADWAAGPGLLLAAEVIQGPSFPNLYSLRGTGYRDPSNWYASVDVLRALDSWCMVPSHGPPLCERNNIELLLRSFRDAVQFTNDQAIRYINRGYTMDELPSIVKLPEYLVADLTKLKPIQNEGATPGQEPVDPRDYLTEFYGSVSQGVREIYAGKVGWYQADPVALRPIPPREAARRMVQLSGGDAKVLAAAQVALDEGLRLPKGDTVRQEKLQWAAELASLVIRAGVTDPNYPTSIRETETCRASASAQVQQAKGIKSLSFALLAEVEINPNWRNWYAASSRELDCILPLSKVAGGLVSSTIITALPSSQWVQSLGLRLKAEETVKQGVNRSVGFYVRNETWAGNAPSGSMLTVRKGVAQFNTTGSSEAAIKAADVVLAMDRATMDALIQADGEHTLAQTLKEKLESKQITLLKGTYAEAQAFVGWFDPKPIDIPVLSGR